MGIVRPMGCCHWRRCNESCSGRARPRERALAQQPAGQRTGRARKVAAARPRIARGRDVAALGGAEGVCSHVR
eukprot:1628026-Prymnesium_polylepis.1